MSTQKVAKSLSNPAERRAQQGDAQTTRRWQPSSGEQRVVKSQLCGNHGFNVVDPLQSLETLKNPLVKTLETLKNLFVKLVSLKTNSVEY